MAFKGKRAGSWTEASAVYAKSGDAWLYAKNVYGNKDGVWLNAWTDCRQHDAGGRDWTVAAGVTEYQNSCGNRQSRVRTDYTKAGCTGYSRYTSWVASPDCNSGCFTATTSTVYSGSCGNRTSATRTTYTATAGNGCTTYYTDGAYTANPDCNSGCFTASTSTVYSGSCGNRTTATRTTYTANAGTNCTTYYTDSAYTASPDCNSGCFTASAVNCSGCGSATYYTANAGTGCTSYQSGSCGTYDQLIPIYPFSSSVLYNFLGDGVDWYALYNYGGYTPSNNLHGNGCSGSAYALWNLYQCSAGYTANSRVGQYETNTGNCGYF